MKTNGSFFNEDETLHALKHYLPAQAPLKDFIHHNTLHAFQDKKFFEALRTASAVFGYKVLLSLDEYRELYRQKKIKERVLDKLIAGKTSVEAGVDWKDRLLNKNYDTALSSRVGVLRGNWKKLYNIDLDVLVHPLLFRVLCSYLDQGISIWNFPDHGMGFLASLRDIENNTYTSIFKTERSRQLLKHNAGLDTLLQIVVGKEELYKTYLFDQQFAHQGWSGMVSAIEDQPSYLLDQKKISLKEMIILELLLEIDALDKKFGPVWAPMGVLAGDQSPDLFLPVAQSELDMVYETWQEAYEWSYYDEVLSGIQQSKHESAHQHPNSFQVMFCIDDRETSLRDYVEKTDPACETFATPGFFGVEFFFQPEHGKSYTKQCPAPVTPQFLVKELNIKSVRKKDVHFAKQTHSLITGWLASQVLGFWSALRLFVNIFRPAISPATSYSFSHMDKSSFLTVEHFEKYKAENGLQVGFTITEMADRVEALLKSIGLVENFAPLVYVIGHGSSSSNNPHYAAYNCGACCGRPGSVNARVLATMANHADVRKILLTRGMLIPTRVQFVGGLHDTTRDEIVFYDEKELLQENQARHARNVVTFTKALALNAKERSRRFESIDTRLPAEEVHKKVLRRSVSLFEPRPELNHATNALCIIGRRELTRHLFLDRRAFTNSYDYRIDPDGRILLNTIKPIGPVCGGINLEYFFSRVDNHKLGAGTKLPHNVMGLFGVANGIDGDLRPGLPSQMIEVHDPVRLLVVVEHFSDVVFKVISEVEAVYEWFINGWVNLVVIDPLSHELSVFKNGSFQHYEPLQKELPCVNDLNALLETQKENISVHIVNS